MNKFNALGYNSDAYHSEFIDSLYNGLKFWLFVDLRLQTSKFEEHLAELRREYAGDEFILGNIQKIKERIIRDRDINKYINKQAGVRFWGRGR